VASVRTGPPPKRHTVMASRTDRYTGADFDRIAEWARSNLRSLVREYTGVELNGAGRGPCPLHGGDNPDSFSVTDKGWFCFSACQSGGDGIEFVRRWRFGALPQKEGRVAVLRELAHRAGVSLEMPRGYTPPPPTPRVTQVMQQRHDTSSRKLHWAHEREQERARALEAMRSAGQAIAPVSEVLRAAHAAMSLGEEGRAYLTARAFDPDAAERFGFRSLETSTDWETVQTALRATFAQPVYERAGLWEFPKRIRDLRGVRVPAGPLLVIPYHDTDGSIIGFRFRAIVQGALGYSGTSPNRYASLSGVSLPVPFNVPALIQAVGCDLHIVEGEFNAYSLALSGRAAIGLDGAGKWQREWTQNVQNSATLVAWYDDDHAGHGGRRKLARMLVEEFGSVWVRERARAITLHGGEDVNDLHKRGQLVPLLNRAPWHE
jgi:DNA primase